MIIQVSRAMCFDPPASPPLSLPPSCWSPNESLGTSEDLQALLDATSESVFLLDCQGRFLAVNHLGAERLGTEPAALFGRSAFDVWPAEVASLRAQLFAEAVETGEAISFSDQRDGRQFDIAYQPVRGPDGAVARVAVFGREVTAEKERIDALRQAEAKYRGIFENAVEGIFQSTPDGRYLTANRALARMYGFDTAEQLMAEVTDIAGQLYVDPARRTTFRALLAARDTVSGFQSEIRRRDGSRAWISEHARAVRDADGQLLYYEGTVEDITARKNAQLATERLYGELEQRIAERTASLAREVEVRRRAEQQARRATAEAEAATQAKSTFLAHMSHELRTPLNAILGFSEVMKEEMLGGLSPQYQDYAATIHAAGGHLLALINDILDLAKIEAGRLELSEDVVEVRPLAESCLPLVRERAERAGCRLVLDLAADLPEVTADRLRLKQVLLNLLSNAVKFTPAGGSVTLRTTRPTTGGLLFEVTDTGPGIAPEDIDRVLEPFSQTDAGKAQEGTGLGLPLARQLMQMHGGRLDLTSVVGQGTTVAVWLPEERVARPQ